MVTGTRVRVLRQNAWEHQGEIGTVIQRATITELREQGFVCIDLDIDRQPGLVQPKIRGWWYPEKSLARV